MLIALNKNVPAVWCAVKMLIQDSAHHTTERSFGSFLFLLIARLICNVNIDLFFGGGSQVCQEMNGFGRSESVKCIHDKGPGPRNEFEKILKLGLQAFLRASNKTYSYH